MIPGLKQETLSMALPAARKLQQVAVQDIASFTAKVIENREQFLGGRVNIAGDEVDGASAAEILSNVSGRSIEFVEDDVQELLAANQDLGKMFDWFNRVGYTADISALRRDYPEVGWHTLEDWAEAQDWSALG